MKRFLMMSLLTLTAFALQAQTKEYAKSIGMFVSRPEVKSGKDTKMTSAIWHKSNMAWIKDHCETKNVAIEKDYLKLFPEIVNVLQNDQSYIPMSWRLTEEKDETVLHCYLRMPADKVSNLFLTSEETCLVDQETGAQYRIRRTEPDTFCKHFTVKARKGDVLDLKIFFAPLPETTKDIRIYGVSNWGMMGMPVTIRQQVFGTWQPLNYDTIPEFHKSRLLKEHMYENKPYDRQDWNTWKVMTDAHLIKPLQDETMALWRTPEATYLAIGCEQNWTREYWEFRKDIKLLDETGHQYKLREIQGLPIDELFFMEGMAGDYVAYVLVFDPIPFSASTITYIEPAGEPFRAWGANWSGKVLTLNIQQLRDNQRLFMYHPRVIVK